MPTYDYRCIECSHDYEIRHSITESPSLSCEKCTGKLERLISKNVSIQFKGSGFYITDSGPKKGLAKSNKKDKAKKEVKEETKKSNKKAPVPSAK